MFLFTAEFGAYVPKAYFTINENGEASPVVPIESVPVSVNANYSILNLLLTELCWILGSFVPSKKTNSTIRSTTIWFPKCWIPQLCLPSTRTRTRNILWNFHIPNIKLTFRWWWTSCNWKHTNYFLKQWRFPINKHRLETWWIRHHQQTVW